MNAHAEAYRRHGYPPEVVLELALSVIAPGAQAMILDRDNRKVGWAELPAAAETGVAFAVQLDRCILGLDMDQPEMGRSLWKIADSLEREGHRAVVSASGRPGHLHLFARIQNLADRVRFEDAARASGIDVRRTLRPPGSPHRLGLPTRLLRPEDPDEALKVLQAPRLPAGRLSAQKYALLVRGDAIGAFRSASEVVQSLALAAVNAGWSEDRLYRVLVDPRHAGGLKVQNILVERGEAAARAYVHGSWLKAEVRARESPPISNRDSARREIARIEAIADRTAWRGVAGSTDRAVLDAHIEIARDLGRIEYGAAVRTIAEMAAVSAPTVLVSQRRLIDAGWLRQVSRGHGSVASRWRLRQPASRSQLQQSTPGGVRMNVEGVAVRHDAFRWGALWKTGWRLCRALSLAGTMSLADLKSGVLGLSERTLRRRLRQLADLKLVVADGRGWRWIGGDLAEIADRLGTSGKAETARRRHEKERQIYRQDSSTRRLRVLREQEPR